MLIFYNLYSQVLTAWGNVPEIVILGDLSSIPRVPIVSFMIKHPETVNCIIQFVIYYFIYLL